MSSCNMCREGLTALKRPCPNGCKPKGFRPEGEPVTIEYRDFRGVVRQHTLYPKSIRFGKDPLTHKEGWLMEGYAAEEGFRPLLFPMSEMRIWRTKTES